MNRIGKHFIRRMIVLALLTVVIVAMYGAMKKNVENTDGIMIKSIEQIGPRVQISGEITSPYRSYEGVSYTNQNNATYVKIYTVSAIWGKQKDFSLSVADTTKIYLVDEKKTIRIWEKDESQKIPHESLSGEIISGEEKTGEE